MLALALLSSFALAATASPTSIRRDQSSAASAVIVNEALYDGKCYYPKPDLDVFKLADYLGTWYQQAATSTFFSQGCTCTTAQYSLNDDGTVKVFNSCQVAGLPNNIEGKATPVDKAYGADGVFLVEFPVSPPALCPGPNYIVQDYEDGWAIVQAANWSTLFILSRERNVAPEEVDARLAKAQALGSNLDNVEKTDQTNCPLV